MNHIQSLPSNDFIPDEVHDLADRFRTLEARVRDQGAKEAKARADIASAALADAEALKTAVLAGDPDPTESKEQAAREALATLERRGPILKHELDTVAAELVQALRPDEARSEALAKAQARLEPALAEYREALSTAERAVSAAYSKVTQASVALTFIRSLDAGVRLAANPVPIPGQPVFGTARVSAAKLESELRALKVRTEPKDRKVRRLSDDRVMSIPTSLVADMLRNGEEFAYLDGFGPVTPARRSW